MMLLLNLLYILHSRSLNSKLITATASVNPALELSYLKKHDLILPDRGLANHIAVAEASNVVLDHFK